MDIDFPAAADLAVRYLHGKGHRDVILLRDNEREARKGTRELAVVEEEGVALTESYFEVPAPKNAKAGEMIEITL